MHVKSLMLSDFRNYPALSICFDKGTNVLYGENAQGKTNILEAVYLAGTTKSHRGSRDRDMIRFHCEEAHIQMTVEKKGIDYRIDMHLKKNMPKGIAINQVPIKKAGELFGIINLVIFSPEDLNIIKNGPGERRRYIDFELCQLDGIYLRELINYNKILNQRNRLLKDLPYQPSLADTLKVWDDQLIMSGTKIISKRHEFVRELNGIVSEKHSKLTGDKEHMEIRYEPNVRPEDFAAQVARMADTDKRFKTTSTGPHRDDLCVMANDIDLRKYGSQGQQRTAALSLKMSELYLIEKKTGEKPVLLLDDVLSELDLNRQNYLLESIREIQAVITCTGLDDFVENHFYADKVFEVSAGGVKKNEQRIWSRSNPDFGRP